VETKESAFFNRFGQLIYREGAGRFAGYDFPQLSIHRGDLHLVLLAAVRERLGDDAVREGVHCEGVEQDDAGVTLHVTDTRSGASLPPVHGSVAIGCDGIRSVIRTQFFPDEGPPVYSGVNMWRGVTRWPSFLTGASMVRAGWLATGKMVIYPIRENIDDQGRQLVNWVAEIETPRYEDRDWNRAGALDDFAPAFADWKFDWLDVPAFIRAADQILEFPMVDLEPLPRWTFGRVTLLGDAAHPMVPRGSNGSAQAIIDGVALAEELSASTDWPHALHAYEERRREATSTIVRRNRTNPPDALLREVYERTGDRPFEDINDVISPAEIKELVDGYRSVVGIKPVSTGS
jgi:2-polyprenyl-6-methoxyphenol hydroxylase-like FAD-dependent oxidoreductase